MGEITRPASMPLTGELEVRLVRLRRRHLRAVLRIESQVYPRPWSLPLFMSELNLRSSRHYVAARIDGSVVGYGGIMLAVDEAHVTTIAVDPAWQRHQVGTRLMLHLCRAAQAQGARRMTLEVRISNAPAQALYHRFGFETAGVRKNYYAETNEDALIMWAYDIDTPGYESRLVAIESGVRGRTVDEATGPEGAGGADGP
jgi:ribosomal-protein-alanine N-acetyltransferase